MKVFYSKVLCLLFILLSIAVANAQITGDSKLNISPKVKIGKLSNGIIYYIRKNQEPKKRAELRLVVKAGSILETEKQAGLAHFTEHMAFNGTKNFQKQALVNFLEKSGVNFGADLNAYTSFDETVYELQLPTDSPTVFKTGFQVLEDWAHNLSLDNTEIDKERGVVIEEWRLGRGAEERMKVKYFPVLLKGSRYAVRLPIGNKENLDTFKYETVKQFYKDWYRTDLQAVIVVGDVDVNEVEQLIKKHFAGIPKPSVKKVRPKYGVPLSKETNAMVLTDAEQQYNMVQIYYKQPAIPEAKTVLQYRQSIVRELFNAMINDRLQEIAQQPTAPFLFANSSYSSFIGNLDAFSLIAIAKDGKSIEQSTETLLEENERVRQNGFTITELERAKAAVMTGIEDLYNEREKTKSVDFIGELIRNFLKGEPIPGIEKEYEIYKKYLQGISLKEVNGLIAKWIKPTDRAIIVMAPESEKKKLISEQQLLTILNKQQKNLKAYEDKVIKASILKDQPLAGTIIDEREIKSLGVTVLTLSNGATVILKPTDFKNNQILISGISKGGSSLYSDSVYLSAANASAIANFGGVGNFDRISLQKELAGKQVFISPSVGQYSEGISGTASPKDLTTAFQLLYGYFTEPRKDTSMFEVYKQQLITTLTNKDKDPSSVFGDSVSYILGNYHFRRKPLDLKRVEEINLDKAFNIYKERFADAGDFIFTIVGSFKVDSIRKSIMQYIASLPYKSAHENWQDVGIRYPKGIFSKTIVKGQEKKSSVRISFTGTTIYSDLEATQLDQLAQVLQIRLREILREDQGGVYGVGVRAAISRQPISAYIINISFGCAPENVDKLYNLVMEELKNMKANGGAQINIEKVIAEDTRSLETSVKENDYWLENLQDKFYFNENPELILQDSAMIKQLTINKTKKLANQYFNMENMVKLILMPDMK